MLFECAASEKFCPTMHCAKKMEELLYSQLEKIRVICECGETAPKKTIENQQEILFGKHLLFSPETLIVTVIQSDSLTDVISCQNMTVKYAVLVQEQQLHKQYHINISSRAMCNVVWNWDTVVVYLPKTGYTSGN